MKQSPWIGFTKALCLLLAAMLCGAAGCGLTNIADTGADAGTTFTIRIENVSDEETLTAGGDSTQAVPLSPGVWVVHDQPAPLFTVEESDRGDGLEALAEDGDPSPSIFQSFAAVLAEQDGVESSGVFSVPSGETDSAPIAPGEAYEFEITASPGESLSFATMFVPSNDLFFAFGEDGIALFDEAGTPISGDVTDQVILWDAGTEVNQQPGAGPDQPERQEVADTGEDEDGVVAQVNDRFLYPDVADVIYVTITPEPGALESGVHSLITQVFAEWIKDYVNGVFNVPSTGGF